MLTLIGNYWHTLHYLQPRQIFWRTQRLIKRRFKRFLVPKVSGTPPEFNRECLRQIRTLLQAAYTCGGFYEDKIGAVRDQAFCFLNQPVQRTGTIPWHDVSYPTLWRYQLHGFVFARDFSVNAMGEDYLGDRDRALHWMHDWIQKNPPATGIGWDPWVVSERLLQWTLLIAAFEIQELPIRTSYRLQSLWLEKWLELDVRANHLLKNACALMTSASLLGDKTKLDTHSTLLKAQLQEQLLTDGGHYERSPMYHAHALWDGLLVYAALTEKPEFLASPLSQMTDFLQRICHPDGEIPLFGDSVLKETIPTPSLIALARRVLVRTTPRATANQETPVNTGDALEASGYYILGDLSHCVRMIVKAAPPSPPFQPGHSHADLFSFELACKHQRIIVDSGVHGYAESPLRPYCRSTRAHNTAEINGIEQSELWHVFRVGRRPRVEQVQFHADTDAAYFEGAYEHYSGYRYQRRIEFLLHDRLWKIEDIVTGKNNPLEVTVRIHIHPDCKLVMEDKHANMCAGGQKIIITLLSEGVLELDRDSKETTTGWYCPEFGQAYASPVIKVHSSAQKCVRICYSIAHVLDQ